MANNPYVNKVVYGNDTVMDISDTTAEEADVISGKTFYKANGAKGVGSAVIPSTDDCYKTTDDEAYAIGDNDYFPYYSDSLSEKVKISWYNFKSRIKAYFDTIYAQFAGTEAELRDTVGWTSKNLYPLTLASLKELNTSGTWSGNVYTLNSVTFTVSTNADGYVTAVATSGTASAQTSFYFISSTVGGISDYLPSGNYIMNGCANGGSLTGSFRMDFDIGTTMNVATDSSDKSFSIPSDSSLLVFWTIGISNGQSMASKTFYPMIRKATIGSNTFEPYHPSVKQTLRNAEVIEGKNLVGEWEQGTFTQDGLNTDNATRIRTTKYIPIEYGKTYVISGVATTSGKTAQFSISFYSQNDYVTPRTSYTGWYTSGSQITIPSATDKYIRILASYSDGSDVTPASFSELQLEEGTTATDFEPYYTPLKDGKFDRAEQRILGAKNLLVYPYVNTTKTLNGITFTDNGNGTITCDGTATANADFDFMNYSSLNSLTTNNRLLLTGGVSGSVLLYTRKSNNEYVTDEGSGAVLEQSTTFNIALRLQVKNGTTINNLVIKPMLRLASDPDDTYAPYAMTNKELTDKVSDMPTLIPATADDTDVDAIAAMSYSDASQNKGVNAYTVKKYSNVDSITLWTTVAAGNDTIGVWNDGWKEESPRVRTGWLWHECLYHVLSDNDVECVVVFDVITEETVSAYAYRVDDDYPRTINGNTVNGGCVAIKLNSAIQNENGVKVGIKLIRQRTQSIEVTPLT